MEAPADPTRFVDADLRGARFVRADLSGAVMRAVEVGGLDIDAPWLLDGESTLLVNGVDVTGFVDAELDRRFPGRSRRRAEDVAGLREAWDAVQRAWSAALERAAGLPAGSVDEQVDGEWSFAQTLRHLVMATDTWLSGAVLGEAQPYHPIGQPNAEYATDGYDTSLFRSDVPPYDEVLDVRADRVARVSRYLSSVTDAELLQERPNPWAPQYPETVRSCLHTILEEEWEHLRYATRDLDALASRSG